MEERDYSMLIRVLFGFHTPMSIPQNTRDFEPEIRDLDFVDKTLNESQQDAVRFALASPEVALIHGPPGVTSSKHPNQVFSLMFPRPARPIR